MPTPKVSAVAVRERTVAEFEVTIYGRRFRAFYRRTSRDWCAQEVDAADNQIGEAWNAATRDYALVYIGMMASSTRGTL